MRERIIPPLQQEAWAARHAAALTGAEPVLGIEAVVFDAYGTLFDVRAVEAACTRLTPHGEAFAALWRAKQLEYTWLRTLMGSFAPFDRVTAEALDYALARYRLAPDDALRGDLLAAWLTLAPFPDVADALARLADLPLAILSNGSPAMLEPLLAHGGLAGAFRLVLSVAPAGAYKPDPRAYALGPAALGLDVGTILFVSSNPWDVVGAKTYGYQVAWCNRSGLTLDRHGPGPDHEVRGLAELPPLLGR